MMKTDLTPNSTKPDVSEEQSVRDRFPGRDQSLGDVSRPASDDFETVIEFDPDDWSESSSG